MRTDKDTFITRVMDQLLDGKSKCLRPTCTIIIVALTAVFVVTISRMNLLQNRESRTLAELRSTVEMQATSFEERLDEQYQPLRFVADMLANGRHFTSERIQPTLQSVVRTFHLRTLALVDTDGNVVKCIGEEIENIKDQDSFRQVVGKKQSAYCEYMEFGKSSKEPCVMFAVPAYDDNGDFLGALIGCKDIETLENAIFTHNVLFNANSGIIVIDHSGSLIAANECAYTYIDKIQSSQEGSSNEEDALSAKLSEMEDGDAAKLTMNGNKYYIACDILRMDGWRIYSIIDETNAKDTNQENQHRTEITIGAIVLIFMILICYILVLDRMNMRRKNREASIIKQYNENYRNILSETHCAVVEYDTDTQTIMTIQENFGELNLPPLNGSLDEYENYKHVHPEFDFEELECEIEIARKNGRTCSFETILSPDSNQFYWLKTKLIPIMNENGELNRVYCVLFDVTDIHKEHETAWETYAKIPGAVHRHTLSDPIHVNYYSDGFCRMLGYTRAEIDEIIGTNHLYSLLIYAEDRPKFIAFVDDLTKDGGTESCEYRMVCKGGNLLEVTDTMDAIRGSSGTMYGYSVVMDVGKYREEQKELEQELIRTQKLLAQSRLKNASGQMQPHFLYNALSSIREIMLENPIYAAELIYDFTTHLRACIRSMSSDNLVPFSQELENIRAYVNIEKMRFGDKLCVEYDCPENEFNILPLSVQPLVENAVRHGVFDRGETGGKVIIRTSRGDGCFHVVVEDNGTGFDFEATMEEVTNGQRDSNGLANLIFRFETLMNADVSVESIINRGTRITITIPAESAENMELTEDVERE
jgi:PAS domain-containing protein/anti-sigma regulatory factor (Ser/Thr protein kinase)